MTKPLQAQLDTANFKLNEYQKCIRLPITMVMTTMDGMPGCMALVIKAPEGVRVAPGMTLIMDPPAADED